MSGTAVKQGYLGQLRNIGIGLFLHRLDSDASIGGTIVWHVKHIIFASLYKFLFMQ